MKVHRVALIERVNLASWRYFYLCATVKLEMQMSGPSTYIRVGENEFAQRCIQGVSVDAQSRGEDKVGGRTIPIMVLVIRFWYQARVPYMVYPAATISLPGLSTSWIEPDEPGRCDTLGH